VDARALPRSSPGILPKASGVCVSVCVGACTPPPAQNTRTHERTKHARTHAHTHTHTHTHAHGKPRPPLSSPPRLHAARRRSSARAPATLRQTRPSDSARACMRSCLVSLVTNARVRYVCLRMHSHERICVCMCVCVPVCRRMRN
jgi:hypothetical protein